MNAKEALNFINRLLQEKEKPVLNESEVTLFSGCWEDKTYGEIAAELVIQDQSTRDAGIRLFTKIEKELGIKVGKKNFVNPIKYHYQQYFSQPAQAEIAEPKKLLEPHEETNHNPFIPQNGGVDNLQQFFDRTQTINRIFEILNSGSSVALIGEEGIGKSSLLHAICQMAENQLFVPRQSVFLDLNEVSNEDDFYYALCIEADIPKNTGYQIGRSMKELALLNSGRNQAGIGTSQNFK